MKKSLVVGVVVSVIVVGLVATSACADHYEVIDLGPGMAYAINNLGQAVGDDAYSLSYGGHAVLWENGSTVPLSNLPYPYDNWATARSINDQGQVAGESVMESTYQGKACLWENKTANPTPLGFLPSPPAYDTSLAYGINNLGQAVGFSKVYTEYASRAFLWQNGQPMQNLGVLDEIPASGASAINDSGLVVGQCCGQAGPWHAFLYDGAMGYLGELPGDYASGALDINNLGQAVGFSGQTGVGGHACLWQSGAVEDLHTLSEYTYSDARAISNLGQVVGHVFNDPAGGHQYQGRAFLWENGSMQVLPLLDGYEYATAQGINDLGQIVGFAGDGYTESRAVLWNPVPEPSSLLALGSGLAGLGGLCCRRRRR